MRVLIIVHGFPPVAMGGTELYAEAHASALATTYGDDVLVLARESDAMAEEYAVRDERRDGYSVRFVNHTFRHAGTFADTYTCDAIDAIAAGTIDEFRPDVAHVHHLTCLSTTIVPLLARRGVPVVMTLHDYWLICHRGQLYDLSLQPCAGLDGGCQRCLGASGSSAGATHAGAAMLRAVQRRVPAAIGQPLRRASQWLAARIASEAAERREAEDRLAHMRRICSDVHVFFAPSRCIRDRFAAFGVHAARIVVGEYGIAPGAPAAPRRVSTGPLRLGFVGAMMVSKAPHLLLEAHARLPRGRATVDLYGAVAAYHGDESYAKVLTPLVTQEHVRAHGRWPHDRMAEALATLDVLVVPSVWPENSPFVIREAFAAGVPVVASRIGGIPETVQHGVNGLLFTPGDLTGLHDALRRLLDEPALLPALRRGIPAVRRLADDVAFTRALYPVAETTA